jgi:phage portal protein BeeE
VLPQVSRTAAALTRWLCPRFGGGLRVGYDADAVEALADARQALWEKLNGASFLTVNEKRAAAGYSPLEGGEAL